MESGRKAIGEALVAAGVITKDQLEIALKQSDGHPIRLCSRLFTTGLAPEDVLVKALSRHIGYPGIVISQSKINLRYLDLVPPKVAIEENILIIGAKENQLLIAMVDPSDENIINELAFVTGRNIIPLVGLQASLMQSVKKAYALKEAGKEELVGEKFGMEPVDEHGLRLFSDEEEIEFEIPVEEEVATTEEKTDGDDEFDEEEILKDDKRAKTVLIVDDEKEILNLLSKVISNMGHIPVTADRGRAALNAIKQFAPDVIILDAMLPEVHGFEICKKIKQSKRFAKTPVIMISAIYTGWRFAEDIKNTIGADYFIEKPFKISELKSVLEDIVDKAKAASGKDMEKLKSETLLKQAMVLLKDKRFPEAVNLLKKGINEYPLSARMHFLLGSAYEGDGNIYGALSSYEDAVRLDPDIFVALKSLATLYQKMGFRHKSAEMWERALKAAPNDELKSKIRNHLMKLL
ncbi:MAG: hypothetical protein Kow0090_02530 [Myxococcota bacterium]